MSQQIKIIVRILQSAGSITLASGNICLLALDNTSLVEKIYDGEDLQDQRLVTDSAKPGTSAVYVVSDSKTLILYLNDDGQLKASEFDPDSEEWGDAELEGLRNVAVHSNSHLAMAAVYERSLVFYQGTDGSIKSIVYDQTAQTWSEGFSVPGNAQTGTPISAFSTDNALVVSFIGGDGSVHAHSRDVTSGDWKDITVKNSSWNKTVTNMVVAQDTKTGAFEVFALINNTVDHIQKDESRSTLGSIVDGNFVAATRAEAGDVYGNNYGTINNQFFGRGGYGGGYGGCGGYCPPPTYGGCRPYWC